MDYSKHRKFFFAWQIRVMQEEAKKYYHNN